MSDMQRYDILVLGSGEAGKYLAWTMAKAEHRTAVVERRWIGGSCPNIACLPSKNVIYGAHVAALFRRGAEFGITAGTIQVDMNAVRARKRQMVDDLVATHLKNYADSGAELIMGEGRSVAPKTIEVRARTAPVATPIPIPIPARPWSRSRWPPRRTWTTPIRRQARRRPRGPPLHQPSVRARCTTPCASSTNAARRSCRG